MKATLTRRTATSLPAPERGRIEYVDQKLPGFVLRVTANGARSWVVAYWKNGQGRRYTIAPVHLLDLDAAREQARELLHAIRKGADPMADRQAQRATQQRVEDETFGALFALYSEKARMKHRTWKNDESLGRNFEPWSNRPARTITSLDVEAAVEKIVSRGAAIQANRARGLASRIFSFALKSPSLRLRFGLTANPAAGTPMPAAERSRDRVLTVEEVRQVSQALDAERTDVTVGFKLLLLTAQRGGEVCAMRREDVDLETAWWTIPAERSKNCLAHRVPLSAPAVALIRDRLENHTSPYVFPGESGPRSHGATIRRPMAQLRTTTGIEFRSHDVRRTVASFLASMGTPRLVIGRILNHTEPGVTKVYDRHSYDPEKRQALEVWARRLHAIVTGETAPKVVPLRTA